MLLRQPLVTLCYLAILILASPFLVIALFSPSTTPIQFRESPKRAVNTREGERTEKRTGKIEDSFKRFVDIDGE